MNKKFLFFIVLIIIFAGIFYFVKNDYAFQNRNVVKNETYGFKFSYPNDKEYNIDEWDNGLSGSEDGGVYGYSLIELPYVGNFSESWDVRIYNMNLESYLSKHVHSDFEQKEVKVFGKKAVKSTFEPCKGDRVVFANCRTLCDYLIEHNDLLYIIDCKIKDFKFL